MERLQAIGRGNSGISKGIKVCDRGLTGSLSVFGWMVGGTRGLLQAQHEEEKGKHGVNVRDTADDALKCETPSPQALPRPRLRPGVIHRSIGSARNQSVRSGCLNLSLTRLQCCLNTIFIFVGRDPGHTSKLQRGSSHTP